MSITRESKRKATIIAVLVLLTSSAVGQEVVSELPEIKVAKATKLPEGPYPEKQDDNCYYHFAEPSTEAGRYVVKRGWGVISELPISSYMLVSFAGEFIPGTSGSCAFHQGNIGVFDGSRLKAILYTGSKSDELIGVLKPNESGSVRIWSGDFLGYPVADIIAGSVGLVVGELAEEDPFCSGKVTVPTVFGDDIKAARKRLISAGWAPVPQPKDEWGGQQVDLQKLGITETVSCSGTGFGYCSYAYAQAGAKLDVTTAGELSEDTVPGVVDYTVTCE